MLMVNKHCAIFTTSIIADTWEGPEGVRLIEVSLYSLSPPYRHLSITATSFGPRNAKNHTFPTSIVGNLELCKVDTCFCPLGVGIKEVSLYLEPESKAVLDSLTLVRFDETAPQADTTSYRVKCENSLSH